MSELIAVIRQSIPLTDNEDIQKLMETVVRKVNAMTNEKFESIDLSDALELEEPED